MGMALLLLKYTEGMGMALLLLKYTDGVTGMGGGTNSLESHMAPESLTKFCRKIS